MSTDATKRMIVRGEGALSCPLDNFAEDLRDRFPEVLRVLEHQESSNGWTWHIRCELLRCDSATIAELKDYLQIYFPSDVGGEFEIADSICHLFDIVPGVFFVLNASDDECSKVEIQLLDRFGRARETRTVSTTDPYTAIGTTQIPRAVIEAGLRQSVGTGDFVNVYGVQVNPHDIDKFRLRNEA